MIPTETLQPLATNDPSKHYYLFIDDAVESSRALNVLSMLQDTLTPEQVDIVPFTTTSGNATALRCEFDVNTAPSLAEVTVLQNENASHELKEQVDHVCSGFSDVADRFLSLITV